MTLYRLTLFLAPVCFATIYIYICLYMASSIAYVSFKKNFLAWVSSYLVVFACFKTDQTVTEHIWQVESFWKKNLHWLTCLCQLVIYFSYGKNNNQFLKRKMDLLEIVSSAISPRRTAQRNYLLQYFLTAYRNVSRLIYTCYIRVCLYTYIFVCIYTWYV